MDFSKLKVVELANVLAGPAVGMFFAELGAQVIKVENATTGGDMTRFWKSEKEDADASLSAYFASVNWGKQHVMLNLKDPEGMAEAQNHLRSADVVIANFKPGSAVRMGLDAATLAQENPNLIYAHLTGFGSTDTRTAYDVVLQAETGFMSMNGTRESGPLKMPVALIALLAAHHLKEGILVALLQRQSNGKGAVVEVSLYDAAIASLANQATNWLMAGKVPQGIGSLHPNIAPYGDALHTRDGLQIVMAVGTDGQFNRLCEVLGAPDLARDTRFKTNLQRLGHRQALIEALNVFSRQFDRDLLLENLLTANVPCGAVRSMDEVFELPNARALVLESDMEGVATRRVKTAVFRLSQLS